MKSQLLTLFIARLFFVIAAVADELAPAPIITPTPNPPHLDDRYRGRQDERSGNREAPEHEITPSPTPVSFFHNPPIGLRIAT